MQRYRKGGVFTVQFAERFDLPVGGSHSTATSLVPLVNAETDITQQQQQQRCQRCWKDFRIKPHAEMYSYTCWRCSYTVCLGCRVPSPETMDMWVCTLCVKPMNFMRLFETTAFGVNILIHIMTFCDPRAERIVKFLFPSAALQQVERKDNTANGRLTRKQQETTPRRRRILLRAATVKSRGESSAGLHRRVLVETTTTTTTHQQNQKNHPPQRMVRAKTAIKRYSPPQAHIYDRKKGNELLPQGNLRRARTPGEVCSFTMLNPTALDEKPLNCSGDDYYCDLPPPMPFEAAAATAAPTTTTTTPITPATTAAAVHTDPQGLLTAESNNVVEEEGGVKNKFLRSDVSKCDGIRVDGLGISDTQISPDSIVSTRSDSPPPRFPSFSQFLDEQEAAQHLEFHHLQQQQQIQQMQLRQQQQQQQQSLNCQSIPGCNSKSVAVAGFKYIDVVELGGRGSTWTISPNPTTPLSVPVKGNITISPEPRPSKNHLCNPAPQLRVTPGKVSQSISQRRATAISGSCATTTRTTITTARQSNASTHASFQRRPARGIIDRNSEVSVRLHTSRGHLTRPNIPMKPTTPRPFATTTTRSGVFGSGHTIGGEGRSTTDSIPSKMSRGVTNESRMRRKEMGITSPRFARKPTARTSLTETINAPQTARSPPQTFKSTTTTTTRSGFRSKLTSPLTARPGVYAPVSKKPKTPGGVRNAITPSASVAASTRLSRTATPLTRTNTSTRVRTGTPRAAGTRTPLQRITSSRLLPLDDGARRYVPTKTETIGMEQPQAPLPAPLLVHFTRQRKATESAKRNETPATARSVQSKSKLVCHASSKTTCTARSLPPQTPARSGTPV
ncbi:hypothetical protein LSM04_000458 [Trypanosoma melophagium]|uniref:uncharacterized protein n=1 Tax=Trypanosoma melophagium TaxID=715481 RepID=UPI00351AB06D|nr:hypothetical protein LSM04_000458 [Trypanosoma melophagium]